MTQHATGTRETSPSVDRTNQTERSRGPNAAANHRSGPTPLAAAGNLTVQRLFTEGAIRPKLRVGSPDDPAEHEANQMAEAAMSGKLAGCSCGPSEPPCPKCQGAGQEVVRRKPRGSGHPAGTENLPLGTGRPLRGGERSFFEERYNADLSGVRLHDNEEAIGSAVQLDARAFSLGSHIAFGRGEYRPDSSQGQLLLAHELAHVLQQDLSASPGTIRRVGAHDPPFGYFPGERELLEREAKEKAERHARWKASTQQRFGQDIAGQSATIGEERERASQGLVAQRIALLNELSQYRTIVESLLSALGYQGPTVADVRDAWAGAKLSVDALELTLKTGEAGAETEVAASAALETFYETYRPFAEGMDTARRNHIERKNAEKLEQWESIRESMNDLAGEPGASAARGGWALANPRPTPPPLPEPLSPRAQPALARVLAAKDNAAWLQVAADFAQVTRDLDTLVLFALPEKSTVRQGFEYLQALEERLSTLERENPVIFKIPAVFYPLDKFVEQPGEGGERVQVAESIPWQFYLYHTGVRSHEQLAVSGGEWVLVDVTSPKQKKANRASSTDFDAAMLQQGAVVDPPLDMFAELDSKLRFPEGKLYWRMPSGQHYSLVTTKPSSLSDWLGYLGMALVAIAVVAVVVASVGTATPAAFAVAGWAGAGAGLASIGSTLADLDEKQKHGMLTEKDIDRAMLSIGIDVVGMASLGLGRIVSTGAKSAWAGSRFFFGLKVTHRAVQVGAVAGDVVQVWTATADFLAAYRAIDNHPAMSPQQRADAKRKLFQSALLTGALLAVSLKGDIKDLRPGSTVHVTGVDAERNLLVRPDPSLPEPHARPDVGDAPGVPTTAPQGRPHTGPHADVHAPVQAHADRTGAGLSVAGTTHAVGVGGRGPTRGFYFCSDFCAQVADRLADILNCLPRNYPGRGIYSSIQRRARIAGNKLAAGQLTDVEADAFAKGFAEEISRHAAHDPVFRQLMQMNPADVAVNAGSIHGALTRELDVAGVVSADFNARATAGSATPVTEPPGGGPARSPQQRDVLDLFGVAERDRPGGALQPLHFDVGNFGHTYAEVLVPGLPKGLAKEVIVTLPDGAVGRADRVGFRYDATGKVIGGIVYEVKPNTAYWRRAGQTQAASYARALEIQYGLKPGAFDHRVVTYDRAKVTALVRQLREPPTTP